MRKYRVGQNELPIDTELRSTVNFDQSERITPFGSRATWLCVR